MENLVLLTKVERLCARRSYQFGVEENMTAKEGFSSFLFGKYRHFNEKRPSAAFHLYSDGITNLLTPSPQKPNPPSSYKYNQVCKVILVHNKK